MKIRIAFALCLLLLCAGCSAQPETAEEVVTIGPTPAPAAETAAPTPEPEPVPVPPEEPEVTPEPTPTPLPAAAFDTAWAVSPLMALLPQPPFEGWEVTEEGDGFLEMELTGLDTGTRTDGDGNIVGFGADKEAFIAYVEGLAAYDFSVEEVGGIEGYPYQWYACDPMGNEFEFTCAEGFCRVTIRPVG